MATAMPAAGIRPRIAVRAAADPAPQASPNHGPRRGGVRPDLIVLHHTAMESADAARARLCDPAAEVSAHYLIGERGRVWQLVPEAARAWHAGAGRWGAVSDVNSRSIGVELSNRGDDPYPAPQIAALEGLMRDIMARWRIPPARVIAHSDMAPGRKTDPGRRFDWRGLARAGLSVWSDAGGAGDADWPGFEAGRGAVRLSGGRCGPGRAARRVPSAVPSLGHGAAHGRRLRAHGRSCRALSR